MADVAKRIVIEGKVQGLGFRWWIAQWANSRGLDGWVRNRHEGTVEALFSGPESFVDNMIKDCQEGPEAARVRNIKEYDDEPPEEPGFEQRASV